MEFNYDHAAQTYDDYRGGRGPYFPLLVHLAREANARRVLELGAGTGNNTAPFLEDFPSALIALDQSAGMLSRFRAKGLSAACIRASAVAPPFREGSFDFLFSTYMLHHIRDMDALMQNAFRVLCRGCAAFVTVSHEYIRAHPMNAYFPSFATIDCARFQAIPEVCDVMRNAGFARVEHRDVCSPPRPIDAEYVNRIANRFISTYALIPPQEFDEGLARLQSDVASSGRLEQSIARGATVVWGWKECA